MRLIPRRTSSSSALGTETPTVPLRPKEEAMEHVHAEHVAAHPDRVFEALADPESLAQFVPQLTSIRQGDGDRVEVEARYEGRTQRGEAFFRAIESERKVEWGSEAG
jgi:uncharacterized protein YndB with AHSA1/START domain